MSASIIKEIISSYHDPIIKTYSLIRFTILHGPFLEELDQWLPEEGRVLDLGSGFGLFSLYFATTSPRRQIVGVELSAKRVEQARGSAERLKLPNVEYHVGNALEWTPDGQFDAIYMLDVIHHLPHDRVPVFLERVASVLKPGGTLLVKDVSDTPRYKMWFTLALDRLMVGMRPPIWYWSPSELTALLRRLGFDVKRHLMKDVLPYPHILYICRRQ